MEVSPRASPLNVLWIIKHTEAHAIAVHRPDGHRTSVWPDLHLRHANIIKHCGEGRSRTPARWTGR